MGVGALDFLARRAMFAITRTARLSCQSFSTVKRLQGNVHYGSQKSEQQSLQYDDPEDSDRISTPIQELFQEWEQDRGFGSEIWPCEAEWAECEGKDSAD